MVEDIDYSKQLGDIISNRINDAGLIVKVTTDVSPEIVVYDKDAPQGGGTLPFVPDIGVSIYSRYGKMIANYGGKPKFNPLKAAAYYGVVFAGLVLITRGIRSYIK